MTAPLRQSDAFDDYADNYDEALARGLAASGENKTYFARGRAQWLARRLAALGVQAHTLLDFGCGTGSGSQLLVELLGADSGIGVDISERSIARAQRLHATDRVRFLRSADFTPAQDIDLAYCNGVFHHIPIDDRPSAVAYVYAALRPGGLFAFWENNPWNPGTRYVMHRIPFDQDAIPISAPRARELLHHGNFDIISTDFLFVFPGPLAWLRSLEPLLARTPLGGQYLVLCRKRERS